MMWSKLIHVSKRDPGVHITETTIFPIFNFSQYSSYLIDIASTGTFILQSSSVHVFVPQTWFWLLNAKLQ